MRSQKMFLIWGLAAVLALTGLFIGCSDDDDNVIGNVGSLDDPEFVVVRDVIESVIDSTVAYAGSALASEGRIPADDSTIVDVFLGPNPPDDVTTTTSYEYAGGWHILTLESSSSEFNASYKDSVQFLNSAGNPMEEVVQPEAVNFHRYWDYLPVDTVSTHSRYSGQALFAMTDVNTNLGRLNGESGLHIVSKLASADSVVLRDIDIDADLQDIEFTISPIPQFSGCPQSGVITASLDMVRQKGQQDPVMTTWDITIEFNDGTIEVLVVEGDTSWSFTSDICQ